MEQQAIVSLGVADGARYGFSSAIFNRHTGANQGRYDGTGEIRCRVRRGGRRPLKFVNGRGQLQAARRGMKPLILPRIDPSESTGN